MGREQCTTHGRQTGPLCCVHVHDAARGDNKLPLGESVQFKVDLSDDGAHLLPYIVCASCAREFGLSAKSTVSGAIAERDGQFPFVVPTCKVCLDLWETSPASQVRDA